MITLIKRSFVFLTTMGLVYGIVVYGIIHIATSRGH